MNRDEAWELLCEYTKTEQLRRHAISVEAVMRAAARRQGGDEETWGIVGLLHDFDYEQFPDQHPMAGKPILEARGVPDEIIYAIQCHADFTGYERRSPMDKMIFAVD
jgi:putative nucleotidyltransferase with HDIG domain